MILRARTQNAAFYSLFAAGVAAVVLALLGHHLAERRILGTGRRLFALRLARHRPGVGHGRERGALDPKSCCTCWMVRPTLPRDHFQTMQFN
jgi:hypothetical protein